MTVGNLVPLPGLGLGCAWLGGRGPGPDESRATVTAALDQGIRYLDTAPFYGAGGSERTVGAALAGVQRDQFRISTKVGRRITGSAGGEPQVIHDYTRAGVRRSLEESLLRLGLDRVDIAYMHDPENEPAAALTAYAELEAMRDEGIVAAIGVGVNQPHWALPFVTTRQVDLVLLAGRWTLLDQSAATELLPACASRGVTVVAAGVYTSGILADPDAARATFDYRPASPEIVARARQIDGVCRRHGIPLKAAALRFPLGHPVVTSVLTGARTVAELQENVALFRHPIPADLWHELVESGLLAADHVPIEQPRQR